MGWIMLGLFLVMCCVGLVLLYLGLVEAENTGDADKETATVTVKRIKSK